MITILPKISICARFEIPKYARQGITDFISVDDLDKAPPMLLNHPDWPELRTQNHIGFFDVEDDLPNGPTPQIVEALLAAYRRCSGQHLLFQCTMGANRSPSAAYIYLCSLGLPTELAVAEIKKITPWALGNFRLIELASQQLQKPRMLSLWKAAFPERNSRRNPSF